MPAGNLENVRKAYAEAGIKAELQPFFMDMPARIAASHLVFCRSGASTIAELGVIGRPAIMVPLPHALDNDQLRNAESFASAGAGWVRPQAGLDPVEFANFLGGLMRAGSAKGCRNSGFDAWPAGCGPAPCGCRHGIGQPRTRLRTENYRS